MDEINTVSIHTNYHKTGVLYQVIVYVYEGIEVFSDVSLEVVNMIANYLYFEGWRCVYNPHKKYSITSYYND